MIVRVVVVTAIAASCGGGEELPVDAAGEGADAEPGGVPDAPRGGDPDGTVASTGCGRAAPTGRIDGTITVAGAAREYILDVPATYDPARPYPLVFAWHGRFGTGELSRQYFGIGAEAGDDALIVYPQGLPITSNPSETGWDLTESGRDVAFFDAMLDRFTTTYCVGRVYSMGHSYGGYMSTTLACFRGGTAPGAVRAIAPVAGGGPYSPCGGGPVSAVITHGMNDLIVPFSSGEGSRDHFRAAAGCATASQPVAPSPCVEYTGCDAGLTVRWCAHADSSDLGHGWPAWAASAAWDLFQASP